MSTGDFPEMLSQRILAGRVLVGRLGVRPLWLLEMPEVSIESLDESQVGRWSLEVLSTILMLCLFSTKARLWNLENENIQYEHDRSRFRRSVPTDGARIFCAVSEPVEAPERLGALPGSLFPLWGSCMIVDSKAESTARMVSSSPETNNLPACLGARRRRHGLSGAPSKGLRRTTTTGIAIMTMIPVSVKKHSCYTNSCPAKQHHKLSSSP